MQQSLLILSDIWGDTVQLDTWLSPVLCPLQMPYKVISPYSQVTEFSSEQDAYQQFLATGGVSAYVAKAQAQLTPNMAVLGFSAGGAAAFVLATSTEPPTRVLAVYGGQIHRLSNTQVCCPTDLLFSDERHFDVPALIERLQHPLISAEHWSLPHGFANPRSAAFDADAQQQLTQRIQQWLLGAEKTKGA